MDDPLPSPTDPPPPPRAPRGRWLRIALAGSLALNLAGLGIVAGLALRGAPPHPPPRVEGLGRYATLLPEPYRRDLARALRASYDDWRADRGALRAQRADLIAVIVEEPFAPEEARAVLARQQDAVHALFTRGANLLVAEIARMSPAERRAYAEALAALPEGPMHRAHGRRHHSVSER